MISNPVKGGWCTFNFGGVSHEVGDGVGTMFVPECLANALYDSLVNGVPVAVELDDEGETTILATGNEGCWFVIRNHYDAKLPNGGFDLTRVFARSVEDVAEELIGDIEKCPNEWDEAFGVERGLASACVEMLRHALAVARKRESEYERLMAEAHRYDNSAARQNKKSEDVCQSYRDWEHTPHGRKMIAKSESIDWEKRKFIIGFPGNGWTVFQLGDFEFTFSACGGDSPAGLLYCFKERVSRRSRLHLCLSGEGPEFWFIETPFSRYGIAVGMKDAPDRVIDFSGFSLEWMSRQLVVDALLDVYGFCDISYGGCSWGCEQEFRNAIGLLNRAINLRWPKRSARRTVDDWFMPCESMLRHYKDDAARDSEAALEGRHFMVRAVLKLRDYLAQERRGGPGQIDQPGRGIGH